MNIKNNLTKQSNLVFSCFTIDKFDEDTFLLDLFSKLLPNNTYTLLIKLSFNQGNEYKMAGRQIGLQISNEFNKEEISDIYKIIKDRIHSSMENYRPLGEVDSVEILYYKISTLPELKLKKIPVYIKNKIPNNLSNKKNIDFNFNQKILPLTTNERYYGYFLTKNHPRKTELYKLIKNNLELSNNRDIKISIDDMFYLYKPDTSLQIPSDSIKHWNPKDRSYVIVINNKPYKSNIITPNKTNFNYKHIFDSKNGMYIMSVLDNNIQENKFNRTIGNVTLFLEEENIYKLDINVKLDSVKSKIERIETERNILFGTFDLETFLDTESNHSKVYAAGFRTYLMNESSELYYLTDFRNSKDLILHCINEMLVPKYHNYTFYCHNFGNYDLYFIYKVLEDFNYTNKNHNDYKNIDESLITDSKDLNLSPDHLSNFNWNALQVKKYYMNLIFRDDQVLKLEIKIKNSKNKITKITFIDSFNLLNKSLEQLALDFDVKTKKGKFPYTFVNQNNLNYIGPIPEKKYFNQITNSEYCNLMSLYKNWDLKLNTLSYLDKDLKSLLEVINEFSKILYYNFNIDLTKSMTISRLALNIYLNKYLPKQMGEEKDKNNTTNINSNIPLINKHSLFSFIYSAYYGGMTEVYKPYGENLKYIDVNSLYPFAALNPMPGTECKYIEILDHSKYPLNLEDLFGFFYAKVKTNNGYLGLLPVKTDKGLIFPNGEFYGTWTSEELKFARDNGYSIQIIKGYNFNKVDNIFNDYVRDLFKIKKEANSPMKYVAKSLLNNLLGRFGLNIYKPVTSSINKNTRDYLFSTRLIKSHKFISEDRYLVSYIPGLSNEICIEHGLDPVLVADFERKNKITDIYNKLNITYQDTSIAITAMVNSYARIYMNKIKLDLLKAKGQIYYSDTDSLVYKDYDLPDHLLGPELGQFKLEYTIDKGYFISNKTYCLILKNNNCVIKAKGVLKDTLNISNFENMYFSKLNIKAFKNQSDKSFEFATVNIQNKEIELNYNSYTKRTKIYDKDSMLWIDTKPLFLEQNKE